MSSNNGTTARQAWLAATLCVASCLAGCVVEAGTDGTNDSVSGGGDTVGGVSVGIAATGSGCLSAGVVIDESVSADATLNCPLYLIKRLEIKKGRLKIPKGTRLEMQLDGTIWVDTSAAIEAIGTADEPIVIEGVAGVASRWRAFVIKSIDPTNVLRFVTIRDGGSDTYYTAEKAALYRSEDAKLTLEDCTFEANLGSHVFVDDKAAFVSFARNSFGAQDTAAITVSTGTVPSLDAASTYGPAGNFVRVKGESTDAVGTWLALDRPYRLEGNHVWKKELALAAGAHLEVDLGATLWVEEDARVQISGTAALPVRIVGAKALSGYWRAFVIESIDPTNTISHLELRHGGSDTYYTPQIAGMVLKGKGRAAITDSTFGDNNGAGLYAAATANLSGFARNTFAANEKASLWLHTPHLAQLDAASDYGKDAKAGDFVWVDNATADKGGTWPATNRPLRLDGNHNLSKGDFVFAPGVTLEFALGATLWVDVDASLSAKGTSDKPIVLRGEKDIPQYWRAFVIESASPLNALDHVTVRNGGSDTYYTSAKAGLYINGKGKLDLQHSTFAANGDTDLYVEADASVTPVDPKTSNTFAGAVVVKD